MLDLNKHKKPMNRRIAPREDCKYWQHSCDMCGIPGNDYCMSKCEDYAYVLYGEEAIQDKLGQLKQQLAESQRREQWNNHAE